MKQKVLIAIVAAVIIIGAVIWYMNHHKAAAPSFTDETTFTTTDNQNGNIPTNEPVATNQPTSTTIAVSTQTPGDSVTIDNIFLDKPGFVVIQESTAKGTPGTVVGNSALLSAGAKQDLEIKSTVKAGAKYYAVLYEDNGDKKFNAVTDKMVTVNSKPVMMMFSVSQ